MCVWPKLALLVCVHLEELERLVSMYFTKVRIASVFLPKLGLTMCVIWQKLGLCVRVCVCVCVWQKLDWLCASDSQMLDLFMCVLFG